MNPFCHRPKGKLKLLLNEDQAWHVAAVLEEKLWNAGYFFGVGVNNYCASYKREIYLIRQADIGPGKKTPKRLFYVRTQTMAEAISLFVLEWWKSNSRCAGLPPFEQLMLALEGAMP